MSDLTTKRRPPSYAHRTRVTVFLDHKTGAGATLDRSSFKVSRRAPLVKLLAELPRDIERVYLTGPRPGKDIDAFRAWAYGALPPGWEPAGHYVTDTALPVLRFRRPAGEGDGPPWHVVELLRGAAWVGEADCSPVQLAGALQATEDALRAAFGDVRLLGTPATTGRDLFARTVPRGEEWAVLSDDLQDLIRSTSGQGRVEVCAEGAELPRLVELDGRLMYGALCWGLGAGPAIYDEGRQFSTEDIRKERGRYRVLFQVPRDWQHVGLLPVMNDGAGWSWPAEPGSEWSTWCDGSELLVAIKAGWRVSVNARLLLSRPDAKPLDRWAAALCDIAGRLAGDELARAAVRSILLRAIGAFAGRPRAVTGMTTDPDKVPATATRVEMTGPFYTWTEHVAAAWPELSHPEWAAAIWARCRARLLSAPGGAGVLTLPRDRVVAFLTDAVYLTTRPHWPDDGKPGQFAQKWWRQGPMPAPANLSDLYALRGIGA